MACRKMGRPTDFHGLDFIPDKKLVLLTLGNADVLLGQSLPRSGQAPLVCSFIKGANIFVIFAEQDYNQE